MAIETKPASAYANRGLTPPNTAGYPVEVKNTQTVKVRGTHRQRQGNKCSTKLG